MTSLTIISWNVNGGSLDALADAVSNIAPDIVVLQEAPKDTKNVYAGLEKKIPSHYKRLELTPEFPPDGIPLKGGILSTDASIKYYYMLYNSKTLMTNGLHMLDYQKDKNIKFPNDINKARDQCFDRRLPAYADFMLVGHKTEFRFFTWHAPVSGDHGQKLAYGHFESCAALKDAKGAVIIAGDLNKKDISKDLNNFNGLVDGNFDCILATKKHAKVADMRKEIPASVKYLNELKTKDHYAVGAVVTLS